MWGLNFTRLRPNAAGAACKDNASLKLLFDFATDDSEPGRSDAIPAADAVSCSGLSLIETIPEAAQYTFASLVGGQTKLFLPAFKLLKRALAFQTTMAEDSMKRPVGLVVECSLCRCTSVCVAGDSSSADSVIPLKRVVGVPLFSAYAFANGDCSLMSAFVCLGCAWSLLCGFENLEVVKSLLTCLCDCGGRCAEHLDLDLVDLVDPACVPASEVDRDRARRVKVTLVASPWATEAPVFNLDSEYYEPRRARLYKWAGVRVDLGEFGVYTPVHTHPRPEAQGTFCTPDDALRHLFYMVTEPVRRVSHEVMQRAVTLPPESFLNLFQEERCVDFMRTVQMPRVAGHRTLHAVNTALDSLKDPAGCKWPFTSLNDGSARSLRRKTLSKALAVVPTLRAYFLDEYAIFDSMAATLKAQGKVMGLQLSPKTAALLAVCPPPLHFVPYVPFQDGDSESDSDIESEYESGLSALPEPLLTASQAVDVVHETLDAVAAAQAANAAFGASLVEQVELTPTERVESESESPAVPFSLQVLPAEVLEAADAPGPQREFAARMAMAYSDAERASIEDHMMDEAFDSAPPPGMNGPMGFRTSVRFLRGARGGGVYRRDGRRSRLDWSETTATASPPTGSPSDPDGDGEQGRSLAGSKRGRPPVNRRLEY